METKRANLVYLDPITILRRKIRRVPKVRKRSYCVVSSLDQDQGLNGKSWKRACEGAWTYVDGYAYKPRQGRWEVEGVQKLERQAYQTRKGSTQLAVDRRPVNHCRQEGQAALPCATALRWVHANRFHSRLGWRRDVLSAIKAFVLRVGALGQWGGLQDGHNRSILWSWPDEVFGFKGNPEA